MRGTLPVYVLREHDRRLFRRRSVDSSLQYATVLDRVGRLG